MEVANRRTNHSKEVFGHKSDEVQTSDAFWRSARVLVSELFFKWHSFMFFVLFGRILVDISDFSEIQLVCDLRTDGRTDIPSSRDARTHLKMFMTYV